MNDTLPPVMVPPGTIFTGNGASWEVGHRIGQGSFGTVFEARSVNSTTTTTTTTSSSTGTTLSSSSNSLSSLPPSHGESSSTTSAYPYILKLARVPSVSSSKSRTTKTKKNSVSLSTVASNILYKEYILYNVHFRTFKHLPQLPRNAYGMNNERTYVWLVLPRYKYTLRSVIEPLEQEENRSPTSTTSTTTKQVSHSTVSSSISSNGIGIHVPIVPWPTVCLIMIQMIDVLEHIHRAGYVYIDINADNIMIGENSTTYSSSTHTGKKYDQIFLIDMGLTTAYQTFDHQSKPATINGTPMFITSSAARGWSMSPRDDLESLGYLLLYMLRGKQGIPWRNVQDYSTLGTVKVQTTVNDMVQGLQFMSSDSLTNPKGNPKDIRSSTSTTNGTSTIATTVEAYLTMVRNLSPNDTINYDQVRKLFRPFIVNITTASSSVPTLIFRPVKGRKIQHTFTVNSNEVLLSSGSSSGQKRNRKSTGKLKYKTDENGSSSSNGTDRVSSDSKDNDTTDKDNHYSPPTRKQRCSNQSNDVIANPTLETQTLTNNSPTTENSTTGIFGTLVNFISNLWYGTNSTNSGNGYSNSESPEFGNNISLSNSSPSLITTENPLPVKQRKTEANAGTEPSIAKTAPSSKPAIRKSSRAKASK